MNPTNTQKAKRKIIESHEPTFEIYKTHIASMY